MAANSGDRTLAFLPTLHQELLAKACLFEDEDARVAWQAWRASTKLDEIDVHSTGLLPLLADKVLRCGFDDPAYNKYRGVQRRTWLHNQLRLVAAATALRRLDAEKIPVMVLAGAVIASTYYETMSLRPIDAVDLHVRPADGLKTLDLLEGLGWRVAPGHLRPRSHREFAVRPCCTLVDRPVDAGGRINLHWRPFWPRYSGAAETSLWERAVWSTMNGAPYLSPGAADLLVQVCAHGAMWSDLPPVQWAVDAAFLVRSGTVDWTHLLAQAQRLGLAPALFQTLHYVQTAMRAAVPDTVIRKLAQIQVRPVERLIHESRLQPPGEVSLFALLRIHHHIAWHELARIQGPLGYWRYFTALRRGRSLAELALSLRRRLARSVGA